MYVCIVLCLKWLCAQTSRRRHRWCWQCARAYTRRNFDAIYPDYVPHPRSDAHVLRRMRMRTHNARAVTYLGKYFPHWQSRKSAQAFGAVGGLMVMAVLLVTDLGSTGTAERKSCVHILQWMQFVLILLNIAYSRPCLGRLCSRIRNLSLLYEVMPCHSCWGQFSNCCCCYCCCWCGPIAFSIVC